MMWLFLPFLWCWKRLLWAWDEIVHDRYKERWILRYPLAGFSSDPAFARAPRGKIRLLGELRYRDKRGREYIVPSDYAYNGISSPMIAWFLSGHPLSGSSLRPTGLHDYLCDFPEIARAMGLSSFDVHELFYESCMSEAGVATPRALLMRAAVHAFGPRWSR